MCTLARAVFSGLTSFVRSKDQEIISEGIFLQNKVVFFISPTIDNVVFVISLSSTTILSSYYHQSSTTLDTFTTCIKTGYCLYYARLSVTVGPAKNKCITLYSMMNLKNKKWEIQHYILLFYSHTKYPHGDSFDYVVLYPFIFIFTRSQNEGIGILMVKAFPGDGQSCHQVIYKTSKISYSTFRR